MALLGIHRFPRKLHRSERISLVAQSDLFVQNAQLKKKIKQKPKQEQNFFCFLLLFDL